MLLDEDDDYIFLSLIGASRYLYHFYAGNVNRQKRNPNVKVILDRQTFDITDKTSDLEKCTKKFSIKMVIKEINFYLCEAHWLCHQDYAFNPIFFLLSYLTSHLEIQSTISVR